MDDLISIIIPYFNAGETVEETLLSALNQTYPNVEVIVINDGSDDKNTKIIETLKNKYEFTLIHQKNIGLSGARNTGIKNCHADYFLPLDSDDTLNLNALMEFSKVKFTSGISYIYSNLNLFGAEERLIRLTSYSDVGLLSKNILTCTALIKKSGWDKVNGYDESLKEGFEDWDFYLKLLNHGLRGLHLDKQLFNYRKSESLSSMLDRALLKEDELNEKIIMNNFELYSKRFNSNSIFEIIEKMHFFRMLIYSKNCRVWINLKKYFNIEPKIFSVDPTQEIKNLIKELKKEILFNLWRSLKKIYIKMRFRDNFLAEMKYF